MYQEQVKGQKKISSPPVKIKEEKKYEVEKILNRRDVKRKPKYLVRQKRYTVEKDTQERLENLENTIDLVKDFDKEIREKEEIRRVQLRKEKGNERALNPEAELFKRSELLKKYIAKILFRWNDRKFENKYLKKLKKSQVRWKGNKRQVFPEAES